MGRVAFSIVRTPTGYEGSVMLPMFNGRMLRARGRATHRDTNLYRVPAGASRNRRYRAQQTNVVRMKRNAISRAADYARGLMDNPLIKKWVPPQAKMVLKAISMIANNKKVRRFVGKHGKKAFKYLAKRLTVVKKTARRYKRKAKRLLRKLKFW